MAEKIGLTEQVDRFEPNYGKECMVCSQTPTVDIIGNDKAISSTSLCGVCTWGTAKALDPDWWNGEEA